MLKNKSNYLTVTNKIAKLVLSQYDKSLSMEDMNIIPSGWKLVPIVPVREMFMFVPEMVKMNINHDEYDVSGLNERNAKWIYDNIPYGTKVVTY